MKKIVLPMLILLTLLPGIVAAECLEGNCRNGEGVYVFPDGSRYNGMFKNRRIEGEGTLEYADKSRYTGSFIGGTPHGQGLMQYSDGSSFQGNFDNGIISGTGILSGADGSRYEGGFVEGLFHGKGTFTFPDGKVYEGDFKSGQFAGQGSLTTEESVLVIDYREGNCIGMGVITFLKDNTSIQGECKDGEFVYTKKIPLPKTGMTAETAQEPKKTEGELEFKDYKPEDFYKEPEEVFVPKDYYETQQPQQEQVPVPEKIITPEKDAEGKM
jgi:hypothetical protein